MPNRSTHSGSASPPESPTLLTPVSTASPRLFDMSVDAKEAGAAEYNHIREGSLSSATVHSGRSSLELADDAHSFASMTSRSRPATGSTSTSTSLPTPPKGYRERAHSSHTHALSRPAPINTALRPTGASPAHSPTPSGYSDDKKTDGDAVSDNSTSWDNPYSPASQAATSNGRARPRPLSSRLALATPDGKFYDSVPFWLGLYFFFNLGLTLFNKIVLVSFPFPYTLTGLHALSGCAGTYIALERGAFVPAHLSDRENLILMAFSVLYTINIAVSNISLQLVTVPFHQVVRAATPLFTIFISVIFLRQKVTLWKLCSLLPVVAGVGFATYGDYYFTTWGLILTLLGTFLAALKTVVTNVIQTGAGGRLRLHPLDLLMRMSPLAFIQCVFYGWYTGELDRVRRYGATQMTRTKAVALLINGIIACGLNIVSFTANKKAGALTMTVSANCKQVLTIALAVVLFNLNINFMNGMGILLTLCGGATYGWVEYREKRQKKPPLGGKL